MTRGGSSVAKKGQAAALCSWAMGERSVWKKKKGGGGSTKERPSECMCQHAIKKERKLSSTRGLLTTVITEAAIPTLESEAMVIEMDVTSFRIKERRCIPNPWCGERYAVCVAGRSGGVPRARGLESRWSNKNARVS